MGVKGIPLSAEHRARLSAAGRGKRKSPEHQAKISAALKGHPVPPTTRVAVAAANARRIWTPEMRAQMASRIVTDEARAKMSAARLGKPGPIGFQHTPETRARMSAAHTGKSLSREHRVAISVSQIGNSHLRDAPVKGECIYCFRPATTHDHVVPRGRPGWDDPGNVVLACPSCNASKGSRTPEEWFAAIFKHRSTHD